MMPRGNKDHISAIKCHSYNLFHHTIYCGYYSRWPLIKGSIYYFRSVLAFFYGKSLTLCASGKCQTLLDSSGIQTVLLSSHSQQSSCGCFPRKVVPMLLDSTSKGGIHFCQPFWICGYYSSAATKKERHLIMEI